MPQFYVTCSKGLRDYLEAELKDLGLRRVWTQENNTGVFFDGSWRDCYMVNLKSRIASRVLLPVLDFPAYNKDDLYNNVRKHDFTKYIDPSLGIYIDSNVTASPKFRDQRYVAMVVKDAIVDQFREEYGERPNVDKEASLRVHVRMNKHQVNVSVDTSGYPLFQRGYREEKLEAPLKETMAASMLRIADWDGVSTLVDPMCGSGTILIEAALQYLRLSPGTIRNHFAFQDLSNYQEEVFDELLEEVMSEELEEEPTEPIFFGYDISGQAIKVARSNARKAGVDHLIDFQKKSVVDLEPPVSTPSTIITNPPWGERLGDPHELIDVYRDFGHILKERFQNWDVWVLSGNKELPSYMKLKAMRKVPLFNGNLECRFLHYKINNNK